MRAAQWSDFAHAVTDQLMMLEVWGLSQAHIAEWLTSLFHGLALDTWVSQRHWAEFDQTIADLRQSVPQPSEWLAGGRVHWVEAMQTAFKAPVAKKRGNNNTRGQKRGGAKGGTGGQPAKSVAKTGTATGASGAGGTRT